jgi:D-sedoheptulose 7-phosphate isomerase
MHDDLRSAGIHALDRRDAAGDALTRDAAAVAETGYAMATRFHRGGKLMVFGNGGASTDASHLAVEFMHPVIVGKPALPAIALTNDLATMTGVASRAGFAQVFAHQLRYFADPGDIALAVSLDGNCPNVRDGLAQARELGLLTVALVGGDGGAVAAQQCADHVLLAHDTDPAVVKEIHVTIYHLLWELVHVLLEQPAVLSLPQPQPRAGRAGAVAG